MAVVDLANQTIELLEYRGGSMPPHPSPSIQASHLALVVDDIEAVLLRVATYGWRAKSTPQEITEGARAGTRLIYAIGPHGETIKVMEPPAPSP